jgi:hypothetical protein
MSVEHWLGTNSPLGGTDVPPRCSTGCNPAGRAGRLVYMSIPVMPFEQGPGARREFTRTLRDAIEVLQGQAADCLEALEWLENGSGPDATVIELRPPNRPRAS